MDFFDRLIDRTGPTYIFADESGKLSDPRQDIVILSSVIIYGARMARVNNYFKSLKEKVSKWGVGVPPLLVPPTMRDFPSFPLVV